MRSPSEELDQVGRNLNQILYSHEVEMLMRHVASMDGTGLKALDALVKRPRTIPVTENDLQTSADFCLITACAFLRPDVAKVLIEEHKANPHILTSEGFYEGMNLLSLAINSFRVGDHSQKFGNPRARLLQIVELLLSRGVDVLPEEALNESRNIVNPVEEAFLLTQPDFGIEKPDGYSISFSSLYGLCYQFSQADPLNASHLMATVQEKKYARYAPFPEVLKLLEKHDPARVRAYLRAYVHDEKTAGRRLLSAITFGCFRD